MKPASLFVGYHGCDRTIADVVLRDGRGLKVSENAYDWLGHGIYFWENDPKRALQWAQSQQAQGKITEPYVLGAYIQPANCLDLTEQSSLDLIAESYARLASDSQLTGLKIPANQPGRATDRDFLKRELDCAVINRVHYERTQNNEVPFDAVRGPFWEGDDLYPGAMIKRKSHIQIAVCDERVIVGYFRPGSPR